MPQAESFEVIPNLIRGLLSGERWRGEERKVVGEVAGWEGLAAEVSDERGRAEEGNDGTADSEVHGHRRVGSGV
jgi:hypothetical protein